MKLRKTLALILALAMSVTWCLADEEEVLNDRDYLDYSSEMDTEEWEGTDEREAEESSVINPFPDVPNNADYLDAVVYLVGEGVITGDGNGNFNPDASITRAETAAIICRLMGEENAAVYNSRQLYNDVDSYNWAAGYIAKATELGVFNGDGAGNFRPFDNVTYEQIIKILVCVRGHESEAQRNGGWPNGYIAVAKDLGITSGVRFDQKANAPRSAVAMLAYNATIF